VTGSSGFARSYDAFGAQRRQPRLADPEPAENPAVVPAELRSDGSDAHIVADLERGADVRDLAQLGVACVLDEAAVADLGVGDAASPAGSAPRRRATAPRSMS
jgi:hypothetical protein